MKLMSTYQIVSEQFKGIAKELSGAFKMLKGADRMAVDDILKNKDIVNSLGKRLKNVDSLESAIKKGTLPPGPLGIIRTNLLKDTNISNNLRNKLIDNLTSNPAVLQKYQGKSAKQIEDAFIKLGYPPERAKTISKSILTKKGKFPPPVDIEPEAGEIIKGTTKTAKRPVGPIVWKMFAAPWILGLAKWGLIGGLGYVGIKALRNRIKDGEEESVEIPPCIVDLLDKEGATLQSTAATNGDPIVILTKTGNDEYDKAGGLRLYMDGTVTYANNKRRGRWECIGKTVVQENKSSLSNIFENILIDEEIVLLEQDITGKRYDRVLKRIQRNLKNEISKRNFERAFRILDRLKDNTFNGEDLIPQLIFDYKETYGKDIIDDIQSVSQGLTAPGRLAREKLLKLIQNKLSTAPQDVQTALGASGGGALDNISITWEDGETVTGGQSSGKSGSQSGGGTYPIYRRCDQLPFQYLCKNEKIREIQKCLGMEPKYQTGNFGPITFKTLKDAGYDATDGITDQIYQTIISKCGQSTAKTTTPAPAPERAQPITGIPTSGVKTPTVGADLSKTKLAGTSQIPIDQQKSILNNVRRDRKYVGPPLNDAQTRWLNNWMKSIGNTDIEKAKERVLYGK